MILEQRIHLPTPQVFFFNEDGTLAGTIVYNQACRNTEEQGDNVQKETCQLAQSQGQSFNEIEAGNHQLPQQTLQSDPSPEKNDPPSREETDLPLPEETDPPSPEENDPPSHEVHIFEVTKEQDKTEAIALNFEPEDTETCTISDYQTKHAQCIAKVIGRTQKLAEFDSLRNEL